MPDHDKRKEPLDASRGWADADTEAPGPSAALARPVELATDVTLDSTSSPAIGMQDTLTEFEPVQDDLSGLVTVASEHYRLGREIARGGMGRILHARDRRLGRSIAVKELLSSSPALQERFEREMKITASLQHPAIISVHEAGRWPSGQAFYTMKHVQGRPLHALIEATTALGERLALLPHVIAVADALAYAHDSGVIHRDLKPDNVLIGDYGETVVIDWGLAKNLRLEKGADDDLHADAAGQDADLTLVGQAMGTPAYMPPEQARGEVVDERADVYALGAMLYHLLSGSTPYGRARSAQEILDRVRVGAPPALDQIEAQVPADLLTIVRKAMARDKADRYPSAKELALDLKRFETGQLVSVHEYSAAVLLRRWLKKQRAAASVAGVMLLLLVMVGALSFFRIAKERDHAQENRAEVEELFGFMLGDLREKLEPVGRVDALNIVATRAADYYARRPLDWSRPEQVHHRSLALRSVGDVQVAQGDLAGALTNYRTSRSNYQRLSQEAPKKVAWTRELRLSFDKEGDALRYSGAASEALAAYRSALALSKELAAADSSPQPRHDLSMSYDNVAHVLLSQAQLDDALEMYRAALAIRDELRKREPGNHKWQRSVSVSHDNVGNILVRQGDIGEAEANYRLGLAIREKLVKEQPQNTAWQRDLSVSYERLGEVLGFRGDEDGALTEYRASLAIAERLALQDPANAGWQRDLSVSYERVGEALYALGEPVQALTKLRASLAIREALLKTEPGNVNWQREVAYSYARIGGILKAIGETAQAAPLFLQCSLAYESFAGVAEDFYNAACCAALMGEHEKAFHWLDKVVEGGWNDASALDQDPDLSALRSDPRWQALMEKMGSR